MIIACDMIIARSYPGEPLKPLTEVEVERAMYATPSLTPPNT